MATIRFSGSATKDVIDIIGREAALDVVRHNVAAQLMAKESGTAMSSGLTSPEAVIDLRIEWVDESSEQSILVTGSLEIEE
ncbi:hypothetical protein ACFFGR_09395 [Arthrobacter liuii]|uniref:Uncharacterized protein n=1 Tax=Arthrobacter liuii TaxID=1476996 RepID=A0ABQ2AM76_9MICC|nr:hypothetical protein [Arthrobacter liuii]GGH93880.1 hypothetical protein GCM10007170_15780 [Arthrobacter liuii]